MFKLNQRTIQLRLTTLDKERKLWSASQRQPWLSDRTIQLSPSRLKLNQKDRMLFTQLEKMEKKSSEVRQKKLFMQFDHQES